MCRMKCKGTIIARFQWFVNQKSQWLYTMEDFERAPIIADLTDPLFFSPSARPTQAPALGPCVEGEARRAEEGPEASAR